MKNELKLVKKLFCSFFITTCLISCQKEEITNESPSTPDTISKEVKEKLYNIGVNGDAAIEYTNVDENGIPQKGWLIRDIFISKDDLFKIPSLNVGPENATKLFRTNNLVARNRRYFIDVSRIPNTYRQAVRNSIRNYNDLRLNITFAERTNNSDISVRVTNVNQAQFPSNNRPGRDIQLERGLTNVDVTTEIFMHELGHAIGLRHSDWRTRRSCGGRPSNEGANPDGAIHIPGTDNTGDNVDSIMLACALIGPNFTNQDRVALRELY